MRTLRLLALLANAVALPTNVSLDALTDQRRSDVARRLLSRTTTSCYVDTSGVLRPDMLALGCTDEPTALPTCTVGSSTPCALSGGGVDAERWLASYDFAYCSVVTRFVRGSGNSCEDEGTSCTYYCDELASTGDWSTRRREAVTSNAESTDTSWWWCGWWSGYQWEDGRCQDKTRYLGESCWDDSGECYNDGADAYSGLHMSCATVPGAGINSPTCIPSAFTIERNQCECSWFDWHVGFACGASNCNGHACVWNTGDGNRYCDYQTDNNW